MILIMVAITATSRLGLLPANLLQGGAVILYLMPGASAGHRRRFPGGYFPNGFDIHSEGICIPPMKVFEQGRERKDVIDLILNNVRFPEGVRIDLHAMIGATVMCEKRLVALLDAYGRDTVLACVKEMFSRTEQAVREEIRKISDGVYKGEAATDDDGTVLDELVWVRATVRSKAMR